MPARVSRGAAPSTKPARSIKPSHKRKQRSLNALAIAEQQAPERTKVRRTRLGETEDEEPRRKRQRVTDDEEDNSTAEASNDRRQRAKKVVQGRVDDLEVGSGSDSEGHEWRMGEVDDEDDSELDSDEAFGESDEERFEGFTFRGSTGAAVTSRKRRTKAHNTELNLNEEEDGSREQEEDDLGMDAVDLATLLDQEQESASDSEGPGIDQETIPYTVSNKGTHDGGLVHGNSDNKAQGEDQKEEGDESSDEDQDDDDDADDSPSVFSEEDAMSDFSVSDAATDDNDPKKLNALRNIAASMSGPLVTGTEETMGEAPTDSVSDAARMLNSLKNMSGLEPALAQSAKKLIRALGSSKTSASGGMVRVPLPKRQQDRMDRGIAYHKARETLNRWIDTVKHNRRADHLAFPLQDPDAQDPQGTSKLLPTTASKPRTELEKTIQDIMRASGLGGLSGKAEEEEIRAFEELETNKMPVEEVMARRAELRKARELLFREERRAKRISKIKSKSYRRVHRKEAERNAQKQRDLLSAAGIEMSDDEKEVHDRRRAEERMGSRHRDSKWAKSVKQIGRAGWDDEALDAVTEMARKNEELRRRMEGKPIRNEDDFGSNDSDASGDFDGSSEDDDDIEGFRLRQQIDKVQSSAADDLSKSKLGGLRFMQRAESARKQRNDEDAERLRRELDGVGSADEGDEAELKGTSVGRRIFGATSSSVPTREFPPIRDELEEGSNSDGEAERDVGQEFDTIKPSDQQPLLQPNRQVAKAPAKQRKLQQPRAAAKPFVSVTNGQVAAKPSLAPIAEEAKPSQHKAIIPNTNAPNTKNWTTVHYGSGTTLSIEAEEVQTAHSNGIATESPPAADDGDDPLIPSNHDLVRLAFGDSAPDATFAMEKAALAVSEDDQKISTALPGWGNWVGDGLSKRVQKRNAQALSSPRFIKTTAEGVKPLNRRDTKLKDVIVSEKRVGKNAKYLAPQLPFPYESRAQYERSLRVPVGPEWNTKVAVQDATKPRVMVKKGVIVEPMRRPMI